MADTGWEPRTGGGNADFHIHMHGHPHIHKHSHTHAQAHTTKILSLYNQEIIYCNILQFKFRTCGSTALSRNSWTEWNQRDYQTQPTTAEMTNLTDIFWIKWINGCWKEIKIHFKSENGQHDLNLGFYIRPLADSLSLHSASSCHELNSLFTTCLHRIGFNEYTYYSLWQKRILQDSTLH